MGETVYGRPAIREAYEQIAELGRLLSKDNFLYDRKEPDWEREAARLKAVEYQRVLEPKRFYLEEYKDGQ